MTADPQLLEFYKALADASRLRIAGILAEHPASVGELAARTNLTEPTVSHHLRRLSEVGLVAMSRDGTTHRYRLVAGRIAEMNESFLDVSALAERAGPTGDDFEQSVFTAFVAGDTLLEIPTKRSKRDVILRWLVERFELGRRYAESEVNELIQLAHEDSAWLRREMIGAGLLERADGVYWRSE